MPYADPEVRRAKGREATARWREKNPERSLLLQRESEKRFRPSYNEANKELIQERRRRYARENEDKVKEYQREWRKANKGLKAFHSRNYDASKLKATPSWLSEEEVERMKCIYEVCAMRNRESDDSWHVDHIVPLRGKEVCGLHVPWNLRVIRAVDNIKKGNRLETHV